MKFFAVVLAGVANAINMKTINGVTLPTPNSSGETPETINFGTTAGTWQVLLYGATQNGTDGYYAKIETSGAYQTKNAANTGLADFASTKGVW